MWRILWACALAATVSASVVHVPNLALAHGKRAVGLALDPLAQLVTHTGERFTLETLRRRPFVIAFGYTNCPDVCPTTLIELANDLAALGPEGDRIRVLFVTVDPERDTPERLSRYLPSFDSRIIGLTGTAVDIEAVTHAFSAGYERIERTDGSGYVVDHTTMSYYFDRYGLLAARHDILKEPAVRRLGVIRRLLAQ